MRARVFVEVRLSLVSNGGGVGGSGDESPDRNVKPCWNSEPRKGRTFFCRPDSRGAKIQLCFLLYLIPTVPTLSAVIH